ncbi:hypothetical protein [Streptomyces sp. NBC_00120]|uniref:hypothetical protein n=1 Tax=Streptomyces sp. NBC_00120 TaxID=2975660 RepID=UPI002256A5A5|nr:hypothetical protein [Streptomyces sp. NBC_00120]MCX5326263.1 hypothetical protein [Streptomyces sp. NBC_00120]
MHRLGRRGAFLVTLGAAWIGYGYGTVSDPRYGTAQGLSDVTKYVPLEALGWGWVVCGALGVVAALGGLRWQPFGFAAISTPAGLWGTAYTVTWASGGYPAAWASAAAWCGFALSIVWVSGLQECPHSKGVSQWT